MFVINATCNGCRLVALYFGAFKVIFQYLGFYTYEIWAEVKKSCGNADQVVKVQSSCESWK